MPLYDFRCRTCDARATLLLKAADSTAACPACGSLNLEKLVAPFAFRAAATSSQAPAPVEAATTRADKHVCTTGCQHGTAEKLVKKYLD